MNIRGWWGWAVLALPLAAMAAPKIEHTAVTVQVRGQPMTVRARVTDAHRAIKSVIFWHSASKDAAPFEEPMSLTSPGCYVCTVPENIFAEQGEISYYISAENIVGEMSETPWHKVSIRTPQPGAVPAPGGKTQERPKWVVPALIAGGVALAAGGALIAANSGGDSGGGGSSGSLDLEKAAGTYTGEVSLRTEPPGGPAALATQACTITVARDGTVSSSDLRAGSNLTAKISGNSFVFVAPVAESGLTGEIRYVGTVVDGRIVGTLQGSATGSAGQTLYGGIFSAVKP